MCATSGDVFPGQRGRHRETGAHFVGVSPGGGYGDGVRQEERSFAGDDWWGEEVVDRAYTRCRFSDVDLTEATIRGTSFEECQFFNVRFNSGRRGIITFEKGGAGSQTIGDALNRWQG